LKEESTKPSCTMSWALPFSFYVNRFLSLCTLFSVIQERVFVCCLMKIICKIRKDSRFSSHFIFKNHH
jgi:hypothetical protein